jgi:cysteine synthase A
MGIAGDVSRAVGGTPLVRLNRVTEGAKAVVLAKLESSNPCSSEGQDRLRHDRGRRRQGISRRAERHRAYERQNGIALAFVCAARVTASSSRCRRHEFERRKLLALFSVAEIVLTPGPPAWRESSLRAEELLRATPGAFMPQHSGIRQP